MRSSKQCSKGFDIVMNMWNDKRYHSLDYYLKETFGFKVYKLSLNGGMTCPNRDGTLGMNGCIFCSSGGSGDFATSSLDSITTQIESAKALVRNKMDHGAYIAYFQAYTNTYAPVSYLRKIFYEAIENPEIVALSIATRPDCLPEEVLSLLDELNQIKPVWVELGLQTTKEETANFINRGYPLSIFNTAVEQLRKRNISVIVHIILGLPYETKEDMLTSVSYVSNLDIQGIKLQLMHVLKGTKLEQVYKTHPEAFRMLNIEDYVDTLIDCIERIPSNIVIHRITGDGPKKILLAPLWSSDKKRVLNTIHHELKKRNTYQGIRCERGT